MSQSGLPKILIVDDEKDHLDSLKRLFRKDFDCTLSNNPEEALEILKSQGPFEVLLSDQRMPEMTGSEFFEEAQKIDPLATRVLMTGFADVEAIIDAINRGHIWRYVSKPYEPEDLRQTLKQAFERTYLSKSLRNSKKELELAVAQLKAKDWARGRLFQMLLHEFRTAPQILDSLLELEGEENKDTRKKFTLRLKDRLEAISSEILALEEESKRLESLPKESVELPLKSEHPSSFKWDSGSDTIKIQAPLGAFVPAFDMICQAFKGPEPTSCRVDLSPSAQNPSFFLTFKRRSSNQNPPLPSGLESEKLDAQTAWEAVFEPFVGTDNYLKHGTGLRLEIAKALKVFEILGSKRSLSLYREDNSWVIELVFNIPL